MSGGEEDIEKKGEHVGGERDRERERVVEGEVEEGERSLIYFFQFHSLQH